MKRLFLLLSLVLLLGTAAWGASSWYSWGIPVTTTEQVTTSPVIVTGCSFTSTAATAEFKVYDGTGATASTGTFVFGVNITAANTYANASFPNGLSITNLYVVVNPSGTGAVHIK